MSYAHRLLKDQRGCSRVVGWNATARPRPRASGSPQPPPSSCTKRTKPCHPNPDSMRPERHHPLAFAWNKPPTRSIAPPGAVGLHGSEFRPLFLQWQFRQCLHATHTEILDRLRRGQRRQVFSRLFRQAQHHEHVGDSRFGQPRLLRYLHFGQPMFGFQPLLPSQHLGDRMAVALLTVLPSSDVFVAAIATLGIPRKIEGFHDAGAKTVLGQRQSKNQLDSKTGS